jgi:hypothetical protein
MDIYQLSYPGFIILAVFWFLPSFILLLIHGPSSRRIKGFWIISAFAFNWITLFVFTSIYQKRHSKELKLIDELMK